MKQKRILILLTFIFIFFMAGCQKLQDTSIKNGEIVIQPSDDNINLAGNWDFYPHQLLSPHDDLNSKMKLSKEKMSVPGYWPQSTGYGTYQLVVHFPKEKVGQTAAIYVPQIFSAYQLWINHDLVFENGNVARTKEDMIPKGIPEVIYFNVSQQKMYVLLQVSNFHFRHTGIIGPIYLGKPSNIEDRAKRDTFIEWFSIGAFLIIGVHHLNLYFNRRNERVTLYFGLFCLIYGFRILVVGQTSIYIFFPDIDWNLLLKLNFIAIFCCLSLFIKYFSLRFPHEQKKAIVNLVIGTSLLCIIVVILTEPYIFTNLIYILYLLFLITISYLLYLYILGFKMKQVGAYVIGFSLFILVATVINDLLYDAQKINTTILTPLGILAFISAQSIIISKKFATSITENEILSRELETTQKEILFTLGEIIENRSKETGKHVVRVAEFSKLLALKYGLSNEQAELIKTASTLHDIGKVGIPDSILSKPGKLTKEEFELMKTHTTIGYEMLKHSKRRILEASALIAYTHHERFDGSGYPRGLKGEEIPLYGRISALADVFDALSSDRIYKKAWEMEKIVEYFEAEKGKHFDPYLVDIFLKGFHEFVSIKEAFQDQ
nr:HD domain-containing phosphohydrolase [Fredinandcohnia onubensis]